MIKQIGTFDFNGKPLPINEVEPTLGQQALMPSKREAMAAYDLLEKHIRSQPPADLISFAPEVFQALRTVERFITLR